MTAAFWSPKMAAPPGRTVAQTASSRGLRVEWLSTRKTRAVCMQDRTREAYSSRRITAGTGSAGDLDGAQDVAAADQGRAGHESVEKVAIAFENASVVAEA